MADDLYIYTVYSNPADFPDKYVVRRFLITPGKPIPDQEPLIVCGDLEYIRDRLAGTGLVRLQR